MAAADGDDFASIRHTPAWLLVFFNNMFFGCAGFSIVLPSVWPYLRQLNSTPRFLACVVAMYSVGEGVGGLVCGKLYARRPEGARALLLTSMFLGFMAALSYTVAPIFGDSAGCLLILASRFLSGFDNGARQTIEQTFIGTIVPAEHQTTISSRLSSFALSGIMLGPAFGAPLQAVSFTVPGIGLNIDGNNGPGLILCFVCVMNMLATASFFNPSEVFRQHGIDVHAAKQPPSSDKEEDAYASIAPPPSKLAVWTCYAVFAMVNLSMASLETVTPIVAQRLFGWGPCFNPSKCHFEIEQTYVNLLLTCGGILSLTMSVMMACFLGRIVYGREIGAIAMGMSTYVITNTMNVDFGGVLPAWRFAGAYLMGAFFGGMLRGPNISLLTQIIGPHEKAPYMGLLFFFGAMPRVIGPFAFVELLMLPPSLESADFPDVYTGPLPRTWLLYGSQATLYAVMICVLLLARAPIRRHLDKLKGAASLTEPLLKAASLDDGRTAKRRPTGGSIGSPGSRRSEWEGVMPGLPATPTGVREGISGVRTLSSRSLKFIV